MELREARATDSFAILSHSPVVARLQRPAPRGSRIAAIYRDPVLLPPLLAPPNRGPLPLHARPRRVHCFSSARSLAQPANVIVSVASATSFRDSPPRRACVHPLPSSSFLGSLTVDFPSFPLLSSTFLVLSTLGSPATWTRPRSVFVTSFAAAWGRESSRFRRIPLEAGELGTESEALSTAEVLPEDGGLD